MSDKVVLLNQFDEIEKKINTLIEVNHNLEAANKQLQDKNRQLESQLHDLEMAEEKNNEVKVLIRSRIDSLMERLNGISESPAEAIDVRH
ncbi:MAG: cell division protein ZapB [Desulfobacteraceae bacterium]|nr:cell division protein ZapB [Desulfobacteraceae bacterium]